MATSTTKLHCPENKKKATWPSDRSFILPLFPGDVRDTESRSQGRPGDQPTPQVLLSHMLLRLVLGWLAKLRDAFWGQGHPAWSMRNRLHRFSLLCFTLVAPVERVALSMAAAVCAEYRLSPRYSVGHAAGPCGQPASIWESERSDGTFFAVHTPPPPARYPDSFNL